MDTKVNREQFAVLDRIAFGGFSVGVDDFLSAMGRKYGQEVRDHTDEVMVKLLLDGFLKAAHYVDGRWLTVGVDIHITDSYQVLSLGVARSMVGDGKAMVYIPVEYWDMVTDLRGYHLFCDLHVVFAVDTDYLVKKVLSIHHTGDGATEGLDRAILDYQAVGYNVAFTVNGVVAVASRMAGDKLDRFLVVKCPLDVMSRVYALPH